jgi:hypothetical protein
MNRLVKVDRMEVVDKNGLPQSHKVKMNTFYISCGQADDFTIEATEPNNFDQKAWCLQVMARPQACLLTNFYPEAEPLRFQVSDQSETGVFELFPHRQTRPVDYGQGIKINGMMLTFHRKRRAQSFEVDFILKSNVLTESHKWENPLLGTIKLQNKGNQQRVQFHVTAKIEGVKDTAYRIDSPSPKLIDEPEKEVKFLLYHPLHEPIRSDRYLIQISAEANEYPNEVAVDFQEVYVSSFYAFDLSLECESACS